MGTITEIKTDQAIPLCPIMSGQLVPTETAGGGVIAPGQPRFAPVMISCALEKCQWYNRDSETCAVEHLAFHLGNVQENLASVEAVLQPSTVKPN